MYKVPDSIIEKVKEILLSQPLEIYSAEESTVGESNYELVNSRIKTDLDDRIIGSANLFLAATLSYYVKINEKTVRDFSEEELEDFADYWKSILNILTEERFLREIQQFARQKIKVVVDNTQSP